MLIPHLRRLTEKNNKRGDNCYANGPKIKTIAVSSLIICHSRNKKK